MRRVKNWQRYLAAFMAAMMMFSCLNVTAFAAEGTGSQDDNKWTVTTAELVAAANPGTVADLLAAADGVIDPGETYEAALPTESLVSAEILSGGTTATVTAKVKDGWTPATVVVKTVGTAPQIWNPSEAMVADGSVYTAEVDVPKDDAFVAEVTYTLDVMVDAKDESRLLNLASDLANAYGLVEDVADLCDGDLSDLNDSLGMIPELGVETFDIKVEAVQTDYAALAAIFESEATAFWTKFAWDNKDDVKAAADELLVSVSALYTAITGDAVQTKVAEMEDALAELEDAKVAAENAKKAAEEQAASLPVVPEQLTTKIAELTEKISELTAQINQMNLALGALNSLEALLDDLTDAADSDSLAGVCGNEAWGEFVIEEPGFTAATEVEGYTNADFDAVIEALVDENVAVPAAKGTYADVAAETVLYTFNVMMVNVTVNGTIGNTKVNVGEAAGDDAVADLFTLTGSVPAAETASYATVRDKVIALAETKADEWNKDLTKFTVTAAPVDGDDLIEWTVTYTPVEYTVSFGGAEQKYPYGTQLVLSKLVGDPYAAYAYTVNGEAKKQGSYVTVEQDMTISREVVKATNENTVLNVLVNDPQYDLSQTEKGILGSPALISNAVTYTRTDADITFAVEEGQYVVTAPTEDGWVAYELEAVRKSEATETYEVSGGVAKWAVDPVKDEADPITSANVKFKKSVVDSAEETLTYLNLPLTLKEDVDELNDVLDAIKDVYLQSGADMSALKSSDLNGAKMMLSSQEAKDAMAVVLKDGWDTTAADAPRVYTLMQEMDALEWNLGECLTGGENSYYALIKEQVELFAANMRVVVDDANFGAMLDAAGYGDKKEKIKSVCNDLDTLLAKFVDLPANTYDETSGDFAALINRIADAENLTEYSDGTKGICVYDTLSVPAAGFKTQYVTVTVETANGEESETDSLIVAKEEEFATDDVNALIEELEEKLYERGVLSADTVKYYDAVTDTENCVKSYTMKTYTVRIVENGATVNTKEFRYVDQLLMPIPRTGSNEEVYYRYYIGETELPTTTGNYAFTMAAFGDGDELVITRKSVNIAQEKYEQFVSGLQDSVADLNGLLSFVPVTDNGVNSIVMQIAADQEMNADVLMEAVVAAFMSLTYNYIGVDVGVNGRESLVEDGNLDPQAMVNMLLNSGLTNATVMNAIKKDGTINHMTIGEQQVGGKLARSALYLGDSFSKYEKVNFYITLAGTNKDKLASLRDKLAVTEGFVEFGLMDGAFSVDASVPHRVFTTYLTLLVMFDRYEWEDITDITLRSEVEQFLDILQSADMPTLTTADIQTLLNKAGLDVDLSDYSVLFDRVLSTLQNATSVPGTFTSASEWEITASYDIKELMADKLGDVEFNNTVLSIPVSISVTNYGDLADMEAVVLALPTEASMEAVTNLFKYTNDVAGELANATGPIYVMLLQDYEGDLAANTTAVLDLNGKTVTGKITGTDLTITSRVLGAADAGVVDGEISGTVSLAAGTYTGDVAAFVKNGYALVDGTVVNEYYTIEDDGSTMTVTLNLEAMMAQLDQGNLQTLLMDVMSDALLNIESYASAKVNDQVLYDFNIDVVESIEDAKNKDIKAIGNMLLDQVDVSGVKNMLKEILADLTDVETVKAALKNGGTMATYEYEVANWNVVPGYDDASGLSVTITSGNTKTKTVVVNAKPLNEAQQDTVSKLYSAITDLVDISNREISLGNLTIGEEYSIHWDGAVAKADVTVDLTTEDGMASDYVTMLALILANNVQDADEKEAFVADILYYYNNEWSGNLEDRFETLTVGDLVNALDALHTGEGETDINWKATDLKSLKELIADLASVVGDTSGKYLQQIVNETAIPDDAKLPGQTAEYMNFADLEKIAELEDIYDVVLAMAVKLAEGINYVANADSAEAVANNMEDLLSKPISGLYDGETAKYRTAELNLTLKLFDDTYTGTVDKAKELITALPAEMPDDVADLDAFYQLVLQLAKIDELLDGMSDGAKALVESLCGADYAKLDAIRQYVANHGSDLNDYIEQMIGALPEAILTIGDDLIDEHRDPAEYAADKAEVAEIRAVYESIKEYAGENDLGISDETLALAEAYFAHWDVKLQNVIDMINAANELESDNEAKLDALLEAKAAYDALGPNAQAYVDAMTAEVLDEAIDEFDISNMLWVSEIEAQTYTGSAIKPEIRVYEGTTLLQEKVDYTVSYKNNTKVFNEEDFEGYREAYNTAKADYEAKTADYKAAEDAYNAEKAEYDEAKANYDQARKEKLDSATQKKLKDWMTIQSKEMSAAKTEMSKAKTAMTKAQSALTQAEKALAAKAPAVIVTFKKNYTGSAYRYFAINPVDLATANTEGSNLTIDPICVADGTKVSAIKPVVKLNGKAVSTSEYEVWVSEYIDPDLYPGGAGSEPLGKNDALSADTEYIVTVAAKENGNFTGYYNTKIDIASYLMSKATIGQIPAQNYADWVEWAEQNPELKDANGNVLVMPDRVFQYSADDDPTDNVDVAPEMHIDEITVTYGSKKIKLFKDIHYTVSYQNNTGAGTATVIITGTGRSITADEFKDLTYSYTDIMWENYENLSFTGTKTATFKINGIKLTSSMLKITNGKNFTDKIYTGEEIELIAYGQYGDAPGEYKMVNDDTTLTEGKDYTVSYSNNVNKGTATVTFAGMGNYTGTVKKTFKIVAADFNGPTTYTQFETVVTDAVYSKSGAKAEVVVMRNNTVLVEGKDYTLSYKNNMNTVSSEEIEVANNNYIEKLWAYGDAFDAYNSALNAYNADRTNADLKAKMNEAKVKMNEAKAAETAAYKALQKMPTVTITGKGNYSGKLTETFAITPADFSQMVGTAKDVLYKDRAGNFKTTFTITDADGKKLSTSDYDSKNVKYAYQDYDGNWVEITDVNYIVELAEMGFANMRVVVSPKSDNYIGNLTIEYRLYSTDISKAKIARNSKAVFVYDRNEQDFVGTSDLTLTFNGVEMEMLAEDNAATADFKVSCIKHTFPGTATAEIVGLNEFGGTKKITFTIKKNSEAVSALDDRIHYFERTANTVSFFSSDSADLMLYTAKPIVLF